MGLPFATVKKFPPITKQHALAIAARAAMSHGGQLECHSRKPDNCRLYGINTDQPCWYVYAPWADETGKSYTMARQAMRDNFLVSDQQPKLKSI